MTALEIHGLTAGYGELAVVHDVDLSVSPGEIVCLLGANGGGKTTTLLTVAGALRPMSGTITVQGEQVQGMSATRIARRGLTLVPEGRGLFMKLTVRENLGLRRRRGGRDLDDAVALFPALAPLLGRRAGLLSGGEQQMLALAGAVLAEPTVLLLDEMSLGLAPLVVEQLLTELRSITSHRGIAVLLVEQHVSAALDAADRGYVMRRGRIVADGAATELRDAAGALEESYLGRA